MWLGLVACFDISCFVKGCGNPTFNYCTEISLQPVQEVPSWLQEVEPLAPHKQGEKPPMMQATCHIAADNNLTSFGLILEKPSSRPSSGRTSGLRGQLLSQQGNSLLSQQGHSHSESDLSSWSAQHPRLQTAVGEGLGLRALGDEIRLPR